MLNQTAAIIDILITYKLGVNNVEISWPEADAKVLDIALVQEIYVVPMVCLRDMDL